MKNKNTKKGCFTKLKQREKLSHHPLINIIPDLLLIIKKDGTIVDFKPGKDFTVFISPDRCLGKNITCLWPPKLAQQIMDYLEQAFLTNGIQTFEYHLNINGIQCVQEARMVISGEEEVLMIVREITKRKEMEQRLRYLSLHDSLTGLYNRTYFEQEMKRLSDKKHAPVGIIICDVDGLKLINDTLGHDRGDILIVNAANVLRSSFRSKDVIARIGGDEFAILLPNSSAPAVEKAYRRIHHSVNKYNKENPLIMLNISVGYAVSTEESSDLNQIFKEADDKMYQIKLSSKTNTRDAIMQTLLKKLQIKECTSENRIQRMQDLVEVMANVVGLNHSLEKLRNFTRYHDIGKLGISDKILFKPTSLTPEEYCQIRKHCEIGHRIAQSSPDLMLIADWILKHHEWYNGSGYPLGLKGEEIPLECRIFSIADAYDTMTNNQPYKRAMTHEEALAELRRCAGTQFDRGIVEIFIQLFDEN
ncbi:diguanylate cyclase and metal dependent phosphohydrolase [Desulfofarcimen acetoxidans DSM 771]|jgi:diguanylate cyclase (GGDEF)-like protein|uniref:Diguanylate cyclase and metal dependent phosphohydrolase n=1 Tax=Desulfofarcimen acetoxidans (strain ATCC 49208 / DSM 771 / KCTC 5769 / VKM B-1644 / 5575) TaxID=485916 RepID=C8VY17_DESAS|nr:HD-GYP domain-containing protein [Desulfofarcimen acetoxidans]ACV64646.1 diguanylate cyclase and metal dependent phosphohydrolase [Desulfofarcimen acetoxidans DSM 771]